MAYSGGMNGGAAWAADPPAAAATQGALPGRDPEAAAPKSLLSVLVSDRAGTLVRVAELFSRRGYNIESLTVGASAEKGLSRMTIAVREDGKLLDQVQRQLEKLVDVASVRRISPGSGVCRELALVKVAAAPPERAQLIQMAEVFRARVVDVSPESLILEVTGDGDKVDGFIELLAPYGIRELARTGLSALERGPASLSLT